MKTILSMVLAVCFLMSGTSSAMEKILIEGTGDSQDLLRLLAKEYEKTHPGTHIEVPDSIGTTGGIRAVADGKCNLGRTARKLKEKEKAYNLNYIEFAYSPVVFIANLDTKRPDNLNTEQIIGIYSGKLTSWEAVGGEKQPIYVVNRQEDESTRTLLEQTIVGLKEIKTPVGKTIYSTPEAIGILKQYKNTIGYGPMSMVIDSPLTIMKIDGIYASLKNVQNGSYKLVLPFGFVWKGELSGLAKGFLDFLFTKEAQTIIINSGTVPAPSKAVSP
ncbi:substrate-binding domain-containing protein [Candidatus Magnetominusculus xianensis]|uniref:Phosphate ABC transporter substrate-binding protein n=1 Tax=Candidatus Magnetominusculus xianensis TaxID=1748249 RepID=A0ABR5SEC9_9BACT|nr:substrate-binding domain-containing protein [Candidatus Magnetominusculus xianensis]KWT84158.1 phosphate ABC transporter substrate-binding protein [Candidatus Magnetominusculus xianensis]MBF0402450.1 substrate-binding domain-containing protein [Nitrospirota bacterium]